MVCEIYDVPPGSRNGVCHLWIFVRIADRASIATKLSSLNENLFSKYPNLKSSILMSSELRVGMLLGVSVF